MGAALGDVLPYMGIIKGFLYEFFEPSCRNVIVSIQLTQNGWSNLLKFAENGISTTLNCLAITVLRNCFSNIFSVKVGVLTCFSWKRRLIITTIVLLIVMGDSVRFKMLLKCVFLKWCLLKYFFSWIKVLFIEDILFPLDFFFWYSLESSSGFWWIYENFLSLLQLLLKVLKC